MNAEPPVQNTITVGYFITPLSAMDTSGQKIIRGMLQLNHTLAQKNLIQTEHYHQQQQNRHSSKVHMEHFSRVDYMLGHKTNLSKFKNIEAIPSIFSDHNGMTIEIQHIKYYRK